MIVRKLQPILIDLLRQFPAVGLLGPRQAGKTTLALELAAAMQPAPIYLDLEDPSDLVKLADPVQYFAQHHGRLLILDEIHRLPEIFRILRSVIDKRRRQGEQAGQFFILGSASLDLLQQSSESLAGRIVYQELGGISVEEIQQIAHISQEKLWVRGGFPGSLLLEHEQQSYRWRQSFIRTYLERELPDLGPRIPAATLRRLWTMLAHHQGGLLNTSQLAVALDLAPRTTKRYLELLNDLLLVRTLSPWYQNVGKRLVKTPKIYIRDSGLLHCLLNLPSWDDILAHPIVGASWEGFVVEQLLSHLPEGDTAWFYRTAAGAEIDLLIERGGRPWAAIEIKRSSAPKLSKGFFAACADISPKKQLVVYPGEASYSLGHSTMAMSISSAIKQLQ